MPDPQIGPGYSDSIGIRTNAQGAPEAYNKTNNQGFATEQQLFGYASTLSGQPVGSWDQLAQGYTPKAQALDQIKQDLNAHQDSLFNTPAPSSTRASSSLTDSITGEQSNYDTALKEYNDLQTKLQALPPANYQQSYTDLVNQQSIPQLNTDIGNIDAQRNNLPYVNRAASGNAGVETEGQLSADTAQKDIPLYVQQQNLINRLQLAQDFVNNSMKFKQMDTDQARQSLTDAINTVSQAINISKDHLTTLNTLQQQQQAQQKAAQQFAYDNRISQPFYEVGGTIYRTSDQKAYSSPDQFFADGGAQDYGNVQTVSAPKYTSQNIIGNETSGYFYLDPNTGKKTPILPGTGNNQFGVVGKDSSGNDIYGFANPSDKTITPVNANGGSFPAGAQTPGSAAAVNDPLGIKPNGQFAQYSTPDQGFQAGVQLIQSYQNGTGPKSINGNSTLNQMVNTCITGNPNNTKKTGYNADNVAQYLQQLGIQANANTPIGQIPSDKLATAIAHFETGYTPTHTNPLANAPGYDANGKKYTPATAAQEVLNEWKAGYIQGNGTISSGDYKTAKSWWVQEGLSPSDFDNAFDGLIDKSGKNWAFDYGLTNTKK